MGPISRIQVFGVILLLFVSVSVLADGFSSRIPGVDLANIAFLPGTSNRVIRSGAPPSLVKVKELTDLKITHVLIFKNELKTEVHDEIGWWKSVGLLPANIHHVPFRWKGIVGHEQEACAQVVESLKFIHDAVQSTNQKSRVLFHCSIGEDRTGLLAGLYRLLIGSSKNARDAFKNELCLYGYEHGDALKSDLVVQTIRNELTPLYLGIADLIAAKKLTVANLSTSVCSDLKPVPAGSQYQCEVSPYSPSVAGN